MSVTGSGYFVKNIDYEGEVFVLLARGVDQHVWPYCLCQASRCVRLAWYMLLLTIIKLDRTGIDMQCEYIANDRVPDLLEEAGVLLKDLVRV
jgi:hypothetical protein